jgi:hypothetical protein
VFSLGVILFELTTGVSLFGGAGEQATREAIVRGRYPRPSSVRRRYPRDLDAIVSRALAPDPADRFASAASVQLALEDFVRASGLDPCARSLSEHMGSLFERATRRSPPPLPAVEEESPTPVERAHRPRTRTAEELLAFPVLAGPLAGPWVGHGGELRATLCTDPAAEGDHPLTGAPPDETAGNPAEKPVRSRLCVFLEALLWVLILSVVFGLLYLDMRP